MDSQSGTITVDGFELGYCVEGTGRDVLVVGSALYYRRTFSSELRHHLRLNFVDHRGFGRATASYSDASFELDVLVDDIEEARRALGLSEVVLLGHSGHGYLAMAYAHKYPHAVSHIILLAMSPDSSMKSFKAADRYLEESVCPERKARLTANMARLPDELAGNPPDRFIRRSLLSGPRIWYDFAYDAAPLWRDVTVIPEMFDYVWGKLWPSFDITEGLDQLYQPVFLGLGRYDYWNPPHLWETVRQQFHDLRIRVFEKSGHNPQLEEAELFDQELLAWLAQKP